MIQSWTSEIQTAEDSLVAVARVSATSFFTLSHLRFSWCRHLQLSRKAAGHGRDAQHDAPDVRRPSYDACRATYDFGANRSQSVHDYRTQHYLRRQHDHLTTVDCSIFQQRGDLRTTGCVSQRPGAPCWQNRIGCRQSASGHQPECKGKEQLARGSKALLT